MGADRYFQFSTVAECEAFKQGVEYANDSALIILGVFKVRGKAPRQILDQRLYVWICDEDKSPKESEKKPPRWKSRVEIEVD